MLSSLPNPIADLIELLGGPTPVATAMSVPSTTVSNWKARKSIPARYHAAFIRISDGRVTPEMLVDAHEKAMVA